MSLNDIFEITGDHVAQLGDADLRTLIGLLCEADFRQAGLPVDGITWGGHQDAPDGGLDVVVASEQQPPTTSFVKRCYTGIQVKKPDMPVSKITKEMKPKGITRNVIKELIQKQGSYLIACSSGSTTDQALKDRIQAMRDAVSHEEGHEHLNVNFLDQGLIATWIRNHPALILWIRQKIGRPLKGWHPYENWSKSPAGIDEEYIFDDGLRLSDRTSSNTNGLSAKDGLANLQELLNQPGKCVRLAGLSGVGKTRFVQALFDQRLSQNALKSHEAIYTDISEGPVPDALGMLDQLLAGKTRAVLIVDNCPPSLHSQLARKSSESGSSASLLTVEYDVRDDLPDETDVFRLAPASEKLIEELLHKRYAHINQVDAKTIATFSGGNARLAIALANTVKRSETLSGFREEDLFERLFHQRQGEDKDLLISAEALSLVYSFEGTDTTSNESELKFLASLVDKDPAVLYRHVGVLKERDLVQSRHVWRAVLPHAIANKLAQRAVKSIPKDVLVPAFINRGSERLFKSFTRRLGYLHDSQDVVDIVDNWLARDGWIGKRLARLSEFEMAVLTNISPVSPEKVMDAIYRASIESENFISHDNRHVERYVGLLRKIAYEPKLFIQSARLMCEFAVIAHDKPQGSAKDQLKALFFAYLSGTQASEALRAKFLDELFQSTVPAKQSLGFMCLDAALKCWHFSSSYEFDFGARPRDFGYQPETREDVIKWFRTFVDLCGKYAIGEGDVSDGVRRILANNFRPLWLKVGDYDYLVDMVQKIHHQRPWSECWIAVKRTIALDRERFDAEAQSRIQALEAFLRPLNLLEKARIFAFSDDALDLDEDLSCEEHSMERMERSFYIAQELAGQVVQDEAIFQAMLPELVSVDAKRTFCFGEGLAEGSLSLERTWSSLVESFGRTEKDKRQSRALVGFIRACGRIDSEFYHSVMDSMVDDALLAEYFPYFQISHVEDPYCVNRLKKSLKLAKAPSERYQYLAFGRAHERIDDNELAELLNLVIALPNGNSVAVEILQMRFHGKRDVVPSDALVAVAERVLLAVSFCDGRRNGDGGYALAQIVSKYLIGPSAKEVASKLFDQLVSAISEHVVYVSDYPTFIDSLARINPEGFLDAFFGNDEFAYSGRFDNDFREHENPLNWIEYEVLVAWCESDFERRYTTLSAKAPTFSFVNEKPVWKAITYRILERAHGVPDVLGNIADSIRPRSWSGSLAAILAKRVALFEELFNHENPKITAWAKHTHTQFVQEIERMRETEAQRDRNRYESFE